MAALRTAHVWRSGLISLDDFRLGRHQAEAGRLIQLLAYIGAGLLQGVQVLLRLALAQIAFERDRGSAEQAVNACPVAFEQASQVFLDRFQ